MNPARLIRHSFSTLGRHRLRSGFIMLASGVGVAAVTFVTTVGQGAQHKMLATVRQIFGDASIVVVAGGHQLMGGPRPDAARLTSDDIEAAARAVPAIKVWDPQQTLSASIRRGPVARPARVLGQSERAAEVWARGASRGRFFTATEVKRLERVALIGETVVRDLFGNTDPLGAEILVEAVPFTVIGVLERFGTDLHGMDRDNEVVVPVTTLLRRLANVDTISTAKLLVSDGVDAEGTAREVRALLRARHGLTPGQPDDFNLLTPGEVRRMVGRMRRVLAVYLPLASMVVLVAGGIVAASLMLGAVNGRVGEIGLRRAIGARPRDIGLQFVAESAVTMLGGGVGGSAVGLLAAQLVAAHLKLGPVFSPGALLLGLALAVITGLLAGLIPARRAAGLAPAAALR